MHLRRQVANRPKRSPNAMSQVQQSLVSENASPAIRVRRRPGPASEPRHLAFTLIELILVMALLAVAFAIAFPTLSAFFKGRVLDSEARRLLALTHYGQSRAVSEGIPVILWFDTREGRYGLELATGYLDEDPKANEFLLDDDLQLEVSRPPVTSLGIRPSISLATAMVRGTGRRSLVGLPTIRLLPDGFIGESSPEYVELRQGKDDAVWLVQTTNRLAYELRDARPTSLRR